MWIFSEPLEVFREKLLPRLLLSRFDSGVVLGSYDPAHPILISFPRQCLTIRWLHHCTQLCDAHGYIFNKLQVAPVIKRYISHRVPIYIRMAMFWTSSTAALLSPCLLPGNAWHFFLKIKYLCTLVKNIPVIYMIYVY